MSCISISVKYYYLVSNLVPIYISLIPLCSNLFQNGAILFPLNREKNYYLYKYYTHIFIKNKFLTYYIIVHY